MIQLPSTSIDVTVENKLAAWQKDVDDQWKPQEGSGSYEARVAKAKSMFSAKNTKSNPVFQAVKVQLTIMCSGARRCCYCEDSVADEVEHIRPKDFYPEQVFAYSNYLYACGPCNSPKGNKYAVMEPGQTDPTHLVRQKDEPVVPPPDGVHLLIDPRIDDPFEYLFLDLKQAEPEFVVHPLLADALKIIRAKYTIEILALNERDYLRKARKSAFSNYCSRLRDYANIKLANPADPDLAVLRAEIESLSHPTVWEEMKRQRSFYPKLDQLFNECPELLDA